jgi:hypothetical protein
MASDAADAGELARRIVDAGELAPPTLAGDGFAPTLALPRVRADAGEGAGMPAPSAPFRRR